MKKIFLFIAIITAGCIFYACNTNKGEAYTIKMRLAKGDTFPQNINMNMQMNTGGLDMNINMNIGSRFEVADTSAMDKSLKLTYTKMEMAISSPLMKNMNQNIDSINEVNNKKFAGLIGKSITLKLAGNNEITSVEGMEELMNQTGDSASREMVKKMFSKDQFVNYFGLMFSMYPKNPVHVGETWTGETSVNMSNIQMKYKNTYKLVSVKNGIAEISIDGNLDADGTMKDTPMKMEMSGSQKGTIYVKLNDGYLKNSSYKMEVKAQMEMMGQKMPMTMKADYTINGL